jgi:tetratricopeptide (TPR) repeat protein
LHWSAQAPALALGAAAAAGLAWAARRGGRANPFLGASLYYALTLLPAAGLVKFGHAAAADRYSYIPCLAWAVLAGGGLRAAWRRGGAVAASASAALAVALLGLVFAALAQCAVWSDSTSLWRSALAADRYLTVGRPNLADALLKEGRDGEALVYLDDQLKLYPDDGDSRAARDSVEASLKRRGRGRPEIHNELGIEYARRGEWDKAAWHFRRAFDLRPGEASRANRDAAEAAAAGVPTDPGKLRPLPPSYPVKVK